MSLPQGHGGIFICYRREQTAGDAGRLYDRLSNYFGEDHVFMDIDSISFGRDFVAAVREALNECDILLAIIGRDWLTIKDSKDRRRIDNPDDWVRVEIETALQRDIRVVPVLIDGAKLPDPDDLAPSLRPLVRRQALELSYVNFNSEITRLIEAVDGVFREKLGQYPAAWQASAPPPIPVNYASGNSRSPFFEGSATWVWGAIGLTASIVTVILVLYYSTRR